MTYFMSILMGIIQGVAEFLPISSSGHLALFQTFFGMENMEEKYMFFTVLLHFGTLISVCMVYWRDIVDMIREFFLGIAALAGRKDTGVAPPPARRMVMLIIIATVPLFVMVFLQDAVNQLFSNSIMVSCALAGHRVYPVFLRPHGPGPQDRQKRDGGGRLDRGLRPGAGGYPRPLPLRHHHLGWHDAGL